MDDYFKIKSDYYNRLNEIILIKMRCKNCGKLKNRSYYKYSKIVTNICYNCYLNSYFLY